MFTATSYHHWHCMISIHTFIITTIFVIHTCVNIGKEYIQDSCTASFVTINTSMRGINIVIQQYPSSWKLKTYTFHAIMIPSCIINRLSGWMLPNELNTLIALTRPLLPWISVQIYWTSIRKFHGEDTSKQLSWWQVMRQTIKAQAAYTQVHNSIIKCY